MEQPPILPDDHADTASRKRRERYKRKANGEKRVEVWLSEGLVQSLDFWCRAIPCSRADMIEDALNEWFNR